MSDLTPEQSAAAEVRHAISELRLIPPDGLEWACTCGNYGTCPRPIAARALTDHPASGGGNG